MSMDKQEKIREGIRDILRCRWADIVEKENPHGYELYPDMVDEQSLDILYYLHSQGCVLWDFDLDCRVPLIEENDAA